MEFINGGLAGAAATIMTNPMDVVKTRLQLQGEMRARNELVPKYRGFFHAIYVIAKTDGWLALQKGLVPSVICGFTVNSVRLGLYQIAEVHGWSKKSNGEVSFPKTVFWSSLAGCVSGVIANPPLVIKTRLQAAAHPSIAVGRQHQYDGMLHGFRVLYKAEGIRGYFAGVNSTCLRLAVGSMAQLSAYSTAKEMIFKYDVCNSPIGLSFLASCISGVVVVLIACPLDVICIRLYNQGTTLKEGQLYSGLVNCFYKIFKYEGIHGLYKGIWPLYLRLAPHTTLSLIIWDKLNLIPIKQK